jgi:redox-sensitive bicupin YhaK (pirin superfamily)
VKVNQDASAFVASLDPDAHVVHRVADDRSAYLYVIAGAIRLGGDERLATGDAAKAFGPEELALTATERTELILVDVPTTYEPVGVWARTS